VTYVVLAVVTGKVRTVAWPTWVMGAVLLACFALAPIQNLLG